MNRAVSVWPALAVLLAAEVELFAVSGTTLIVDKGKLIPKRHAERHNWPKGALALVNDPLRTAGWNAWFSGLPNDLDQFAFEVRRAEDVDHLIKRFAEIKAKDIKVILASGEGRKVPHPRAGDVLHAAVFAVGDQTIMDQWFERLPEVEPGIRKHGVHRLQKPPAAAPPTLTLHVGNKFIDLARLEIPLHIGVQAVPRWKWDAEERKWEPPPENVRRFVIEHKARQRASRRSI